MIIFPLLQMRRTQHPQTPNQVSFNPEPLRMFTSVWEEGNGGHDSSSPAALLCDLVQITSPLWTLFVKQGLESMLSNFSLALTPNTLRTQITLNFFADFNVSSFIAKSKKGWAAFLLFCIPILSFVP